jgi:hypothetical protein
VEPEDQSLQQSLARLRADLARTPRLDENSRGLLRSALTDIEARLSQRDAAAGATAAPHRLEALAVGFESEHPALAAGLRQLIELLGQAGL